MSIHTKISTCDLISFDVFDTLVLRNVARPEDIFILLGQLQNIHDFYSIRKAAQREAFIQMNLDERGEITLEDIYAQMPYSNEKRAAILEQEQQLECEFSVVNPEMQQIFQHAKDSGKKVILTTDMYLDRATIETILKKCGYSGYHRLYVSAEEQVTKRDRGELFQRIVSDMDVAPSQIFHIGDNLQGDVTMAERQGIQAYHYVSKYLLDPMVDPMDTPLDDAPHTAVAAGAYSKGTNTFEYSSPQSNAVIQGLRSSYRFCDANDITDEDQFWRQLGYNYGGPLQLGYLQWIIERTKADGVDCLLFISRDGYVLDAIYGEHCNRIDHQYMYGSRTAFLMPLLTADTYSEVLPILTSGYNKMSLYEMFQRINMPLPDISYIRGCGLNGYRDIIEPGKKFKKVIALFQKMKPLILEKAKECRDTTLKYIAECVGDHRRVAFVDVGWVGSSQSLFEQLLQQCAPRAEVVGYYMALLDTPVLRERQEQMTMKSWLCGPGRNRYVNGLISEYRALIELFFSAPHSTVSRFVEKDGKIVPQFSPSRGTDINYSHLVTQINHGIKSFVNDFWPYQERHDLPLSTWDILSPIEQLIQKPTAKQLSKLSGLYNFDEWSSTANYRDYFAYPNFSNRRGNR